MVLLTLQVQALLVITPHLSPADLPTGYGYMLKPGHIQHPAELTFSVSHIALKQRCRNINLLPIGYGISALT